MLFQRLFLGPLQFLQKIFWTRAWGVCIWQPAFWELSKGRKRKGVSTFSILTLAYPPVFTRPSHLCLAFLKQEFFRFSFSNFLLVKKGSNFEADMGRGSGDIFAPYKDFQKILLFRALPSPFISEYLTFPVLESFQTSVEKQMPVSFINGHWLSLLTQFLLIYLLSF